ncbi:hypothetical protein BS329_36295 [Amycolatopsis coloradensis]|uniref:DUF4825 domain-containing protein n=1 Tax=Amycolatopsis coloradensis TaxID=76021 RepID=A0A1R0KGB5_9PSEU|nr:hypothetical protein BS329_36295 [Amycolatopsis coloradensis]
MRRTMTAVSLALAALSLAACGGGSPSAIGSAGSNATKTADDVTKTLGEKIASVKLIKTYTPEDDPNHLLGRPNGYTSKTAFSDSRVKQSDVEYLGSDAVERGGSVEVFGDEAGAKARMKFIQTVSKSLPSVGEYDYVNGAVLVRVSRLLTPDQAKEYETALNG